MQASVYECKEDGRFELMQVYHDPNVSSMRAAAGLLHSLGSCQGALSCDDIVEQPFVCSESCMQSLGLVQGIQGQCGEVMDSGLVTTDAIVGCRPRPMC